MPQETRSDAETDLANDSEEVQEDERRSVTLCCTTFCMHLAYQEASVIHGAFELEPHEANSTDPLSLLRRLWYI